MEIKTCEEYVLTQLENAEKQYEELANKFNSLVDTYNQVYNSYIKLIDVIRSKTKPYTSEFGNKERKYFNITSVWDDEEAYAIIKDIVGIEDDRTEETVEQNKESDTE